jgi:hypothetical protein
MHRSASEALEAALARGNARHADRMGRRAASLVALHAAGFVLDDCRGPDAASTLRTWDAVAGRGDGASAGHESENLSHQPIDRVGQTMYNDITSGK